LPYNEGMDRVADHDRRVSAVPGGVPGAAHLPARQRRHRAPVELATLLLVVLVYGGWLLSTAAYGHWPLWAVVSSVVLLLTLHSSLQHEIIHGHPTRSSQLNRLMGIVPLSFWLPFDRYRLHHLAHHNDERLTDPLDDSESYYWTPESWGKFAPLSRAWLGLQQTLAGRVLLGSFWRICIFWTSEARALREGPVARRAWIEHLVWCVPVILWLELVCGMPLWLYVVAMILPSNGVLLIRSFAEHRARPEPLQRTAIVEGSWLLGPLFLFNNLHALHHEAPAMPWYQYNKRYRAERDRLIVQNGGLVYSSYFDVARRFLFRSHDVLAHPTGRAPRRRTTQVQGSLPTI
jgi:fatty acid desaturase